MSPTMLSLLIIAANGTLEKLSRTLLYACQAFPGLLPYALFFVAVILSIMGAAFFTVLAFLAPITLLICEESKMDKLTGAVAINAGALAGGNFPTAALGVVFRNLMAVVLVFPLLKLFLPDVAFSIVGAIMSFFSSTTGVVCPALFPLIPGLCAVYNLLLATIL